MNCMKKTVMLAAIFCWLLVTGASAQLSGGYEYQPFLKEGKTWLVQYDKVPIERNHYPNDSCFFYLKGDTTINDQVYMKAYRQFIGSEPIYYAALRETDKTVYMIHGTRSESEESTLYDFNKLTNQFFNSYIFEDQKGGYIVCTTGDVKIRGKMYRRQIVEEAVVTTWKSDGVFAIYEGIGSERNPFALSSYCTLLSCNDGENSLYEKGEEIDDFYDQLLVEGKTWLVRSYGPSPDCDLLYTYTLRGDTVIPGLYGPCKKMYASHEGTFWGQPDKSEAEYVGTLCEIDFDHAVYLVAPGSRQGKRLYTFGLPVGGLFNVHSDGDKFMVIERDTVEQKGVKYARQAMGVNENETFIWVEGVGSETGPLYNGDNGPLVGSNEQLISCTWPDGRQYVTEYGKKYLEGIHNSQVISNDSDTPKYDLQGRRVTHPKKGAIYIKNGRKYRE